VKRFDRKLLRAPGRGGTKAAIRAPGAIAVEPGLFLLPSCQSSFPVIYQSPGRIARARCVSAMEACRREPLGLFDLQFSCGGSRSSMNLVELPQTASPTAPAAVRVKQPLGVEIASPEVCPALLPLATLDRGAAFTFRCWKNFANISWENSSGKTMETVRDKS